MRKISLVFLFASLFSLGGLSSSFAQGVSHLSSRGDLSVPQKSKPKLKRRNQFTGVVRNDFLVNDDVTGGCCQKHSAVAGRNRGNFVVCWEDYRNGEPEIYAQRYDSSGEAIGKGFRVNDDKGANAQERPAIAIDSSGNFVICWFDHRNHYGNPDVYAQRYNSSGEPLGVNFKVNNGEGTAYQEYPPSVSMDASGGFVICWTDYSLEYNDDIYAQRYNSSGQAMGGNFRVNDDEEERREDAPSVSANAEGDFVICWEHMGDSNWDIYARQYSSAGVPLGPSFKVNEGSSTYYQHPSPSIAIDTSGAFVVCWEDKRNGDTDIYAQRYDPNGNAIGHNFRVNEDEEGGEQWGPVVSIGDFGSFIICWQDKRNSNWDIYAQLYNPDGDASGGNFKVNNDQGFTDQEGPSVSMTGGEWIVCWTDGRNGEHNQDIYAQRLNYGGEMKGGNFLVNDDEGTADELYPSVAIDDSGNFVVCWTDGRRGNLDIYAQLFDPEGEAMGANFRVNDDTGTEDQLHPSISMDGNGDFVICWQDERNGNSDIYAQRYNSSGEPLGVNFIVNDNSDTSGQFNPSVAMYHNGGFIICWTDERVPYGGGWGTDIYAQLYDSNGVAQLHNFVVNEGPGLCYDSHPSIYAMDNGNFVIGWYSRCYYCACSAIIAQRFSYTGYPLGSNFGVSDYHEPCWRTCPSVSAEPLGGFTICWLEERTVGDRFEPYVQRYTASGEAIGSNLRVSDTTGTSRCWSGTSISMSKQCNIIVCWGDHRSGDWDIYAQRYNWDWRPWGSNYRVNDVLDVPNPNQRNSSVAANNNHIIFVWEDARRGKGWDIYSKIVTWDWEGVAQGSNRGGEVPACLTLSQNYPNPFNSNTTINYQLSAIGGQRSAVSLKVYNILGQEVKTLVDERQPAGSYRVLWDGRDNYGKEVSSGVYFYRLEVKGGSSEMTKTRKMILMR